MNTVDLLVHETQKEFASVGIQDARLESELIWMAVLRLNRAHFFANLLTPVSVFDMERAKALIERRLQREPLAYLLGSREFYGLEFIMAPGSLIPRSETEVLVEHALRVAKTSSTEQGSLTIADVGTGSGIVAVSIAINLPEAKLFAIDVSEDALTLAKRNANLHEVSKRIRFLQGDLLYPLDQPVDLLVANLPYVMSHEIIGLDPDIRLFEPTIALDGGHDGLQVFKRLITMLKEYVKPNASLLFELDPRQFPFAIHFVESVFPRAAITVAPDLTRRSRVLIVNL